MMETCPGKDTHKRILAKLSKEGSGVEGDRRNSEEPGFPRHPAPRATAGPTAESLKHIRSRPAISLAHLPWFLTVKPQPPAPNPPSTLASLQMIQQQPDCTLHTRLEPVSFPRAKLSNVLQRWSVIPEGSPQASSPGDLARAPPWTLLGPPPWPTCLSPPPPTWCPEH